MRTWFSFYFFSRSRHELKYLCAITRTCEEKKNIKYNLVVKEHIPISVTPYRSISHRYRIGILVYLSELVHVYFLKDLLLFFLARFYFFIFLKSLCTHYLCARGARLSSKKREKGGGTLRNLLLHSPINLLRIFRFYMKTILHSLSNFVSH